MCSLGVDEWDTRRLCMMVSELSHPVLDCVVRCLPNAHRDVKLPNGTGVLLEISGECGGCVLAKGRDNWTFLEDVPEEIARKVTLGQEIA